MPIRMEEDEPNRQSEQPKNPQQPQQPRQPQPPRQPTNPGIGGGLSSIITQFLPYIAMYLFRKPKYLIPILLIGGFLYFAGFFGGGGGSIMDDVYSPTPNDGYDDFTFGAELKQEVYDKAQVYEPLAAGDKNFLPSSVSLAAFAPPTQHQGRQGSCVGWASAYGARSILQAKATGQPATASAFSPSFLYNQIALSGCQGSYLREAMQSMQKDGAIPYEEFSYDPSSCSAQPDQTQLRKASNYKINGYNRLSMDHDQYKVNALAVKQNLAQGAPVVIGMEVGGSFMNRMRGQDVWESTATDRSKMGFSGHAMCVVGYDDKKEGGAFQIMNSWGKEWGKNGMAYIKYADFDYFVKEAYGLYPMGNATEAKIDDTKLAIAFGLVENAGSQYIPLKSITDNVFRTYKPLTKGTKFKIEVTNSIDCYTYVFGEETDGSSYVLFPYTPQHSAYCGIVGTRLFPKNHSLTLDNLGIRDQMAVVISKKELDFAALNTKINSSRANTYAEKVNAALADFAIDNVNFRTGSKTISFDCEMVEEKTTVAMIIEVDKL